MYIAFTIKSSKIIDKNPTPRMESNSEVNEVHARKIEFHWIPSETSLENGSEWVFCQCFMGTEYIMICSIPFLWWFYISTNVDCSCSFLFLLRGKSLVYLFVLQFSALKTWNNIQHHKWLTDKTFKILGILGIPKIPRIPSKWNEIKWTKLKETKQMPT